jgi:hypothetical protein
MTFEERPEKRWGKNVAYQMNRFVRITGLGNVEKKAEVEPPPLKKSI